MIRNHLPRRLLELYIVDMLGTPDKARVERHASSCERCAMALAEEARAELGLRELVATLNASAARATDSVGSAQVPRPRARASESRARRNGLEWVAHLPMAAAVLAGVVWSFETGRSAQRYEPEPPGAVLASIASNAGNTQGLMCEIEREEPLCRSSSTSASAVDLQSLPASETLFENLLENSCTLRAAGICSSSASQL